MASIDELFIATEEGETRVVGQLLDRKDKARVKTKHGAGLLHVAVINGHSDTVRYLVQNFPVLLRETDNDGRSALHYAAVVRDGGHLYKILKRADADSKLKDKLGYTPEDYLENAKLLTQWDLMRNLKDGPVEAESVPMTKESDGKNINGKGSNNPTEGILSRRRSKVSQADSEYPGFWTDDGQYLSETIADILVKAVADVNKTRPRDPIGHLAVALYTLRFIPQEFVKKNSNKKGNPGSSGSSGSDGSTMAKKAGFETRNKKGEDSKSEEVEDESNQNNIGIRNHRKSDGSNILHFAASIPHEEGVFYKLLCQATEAKLYHRDKFSLSPRDVAAEELLNRNVEEIDKWVTQLALDGRNEIIKELIMEGYDKILDLEDKEEKNIVEIVAMNGQEKMVEFLQLCIAFEEKRDFLHKSIKVGSLPHVEYMADSEDLVKAKDNKGRTSLHLATLCEEKDMMSLLSSKYPSLLSIGDSLGRTPLHYAMAVNSVDDIAKVLIQAGAKRNSRDLRGKLPSYYFMHRDDIVAMIREISGDDEETEYA